MSWQAAAIAAAGHLAGTYMQNQAGKSAAKNQMSFQERMSNTAYQRAMADMRKAGINPMLAYSMGGASTPGGAMYQPPNFGDAVKTGVQAYSAANQAELIDADISVKEQQKEKVEQEVTQMKDLHGERWERLFATMGPENVLASVQAVLAGVNIKQVLQNASPKTSVNTDEQLAKFMDMVRANKSFIGANMSAFLDLLNRAFPKAGFDKVEIPEQQNEFSFSPEG